MHENVKQVKTPYFFTHFFIKAGIDSLIMPLNKTSLATQYFTCHLIYLLDESYFRYSAHFVHLISVKPLNLA